MPKTIMIDEIFVSLRARPALPEAQYTAMRRTLLDVHFLPDLRRVIRSFLRQYPSLNKLRVQVSR